MVIQVLETVTKEEERKREKLGCVQQIPVRPGTPDCPMVHRTVSGAPGWSPVKRSLSGKAMGDVAIIHRTVPWCTGLPDEPMVASANGRPRNLHATRGLLQRSTGAPD
jgi:hypothetical protein